jgi:hypothetical protein
MVQGEAHIDAEIQRVRAVGSNAYAGYSEMFSFDARNAPPLSIKAANCTISF